MRGKRRIGADIGVSERGGVEWDFRDPVTGLGVRVVLRRSALDQVVTISDLLLRDSGHGQARQHTSVRSLELCGEIEVTAAAREPAETEPA